jgi:hypothetical protein
VLRGNNNNIINNSINIQWVSVQSAKPSLVLKGLSFPLLGGIKIYRSLSLHVALSTKRHVVPQAFSIAARHFELIGHGC